MSRRIAAVSVNHNTSLYMELMLRSQFASHGGRDGLGELGVELSVLDNESEDDVGSLRAYAGEVGVPVLASGFTTHAQHNSHGEILRRFVLDRADATHYLFLDSDVVFYGDGTLETMLGELDGAPDDVFAVGARMGYPWDKTKEVTDHANLYERRLHPCCALFRNTPVFRRVAEHIGFSCARYLWAEREQYLDTNELMTMVMRTHGLRYLRSAAMVGHFFAVSYKWHKEATLEHHAMQRDRLLGALRDRAAGGVAAAAGGGQGVRA